MGYWCDSTCWASSPCEGPRGQVEAVLPACEPHIWTAEQGLLAPLPQTPSPPGWHLWPHLSVGAPDIADDSQWSQGCP